MTPENEPPDLSGVTPGELGRLVRETLVRFEGLAARLESTFLRKDNFDLYKQLVDNALAQLQAAVALAADKVTVTDRLKNITDDLDAKASQKDLNDLVRRIADLEDDKKWLVRVILGFVVALVLTGAVAVSKITGGP